MHPRAATVLLAAAMLVTVAALGVIAFESLAPSPRRQRSAEFQRLVGGLGFGPSVDLSRCAACFDPRLEAACVGSHGVIPGEPYFCPQHGCSVFAYPPLLDLEAAAARGPDAP